MASSCLLLEQVEEEPADRGSPGNRPLKWRWVTVEVRTKVLFLHYA